MNKQTPHPFNVNSWLVGWCQKWKMSLADLIDEIARFKSVANGQFLLTMIPEYTMKRFSFTGLELNYFKFFVLFIFISLKNAVFCLINNLFLHISSSVLYCIPWIWRLLKKNSWIHQSGFAIKYQVNTNSNTILVLIFKSYKFKIMK